VILNTQRFFPYDAPPVERRIGHVRAPADGPLLLVVAAIHGNEPAGLVAVRQLLERLDTGLPGFRGDFIALAGNLGACADRVRYHDHDLNRRWSPERLATLRTAPDDRLDREDREQLGLSEALDEALAAARGPVCFLDLHTTSAAGYPFSMIADRPEQQAFALLFQLPIILGLLDRVDGALLEYMREEKGCTALGIEAGQHDRSASVEHHLAALIVGLVAAGLLPAASVPELRESHDLLERARGDLPRLMQVSSRHAITPDDQFRMEPGFDNIHPIEKGQLLARDRRGEIRAEESGILFMPLYQGLGDDGFFVGRALSVDL
jgi:succinylglutamate desuccinylase